MTGYRMTDPFGQVRSRVCQLAVMVSVTVIGYMTGSSGHGHATAGLLLVEEERSDACSHSRCAWYKTLRVSKRDTEGKLYVQYQHLHMSSAAGRDGSLEQRTYQR
jgi:hypothetical protein